MSGFFISLEGTEGSGKSTVARQLAAAFRGEGGVVTATREPGGTPLGEEIRALLLNSDARGMTAETETLLFAADRAEHVARVIRPALDRGEIVITDRYVGSTLAYQSGGRGLPVSEVASAQQLATGSLLTDLTLLLDLPVAIGLRRRFKDASDANRLDRETIEFHERVRDAYLSLALADPDRWCIIDAARPRMDVWEDVWSAVIKKRTSCQGSEDSARDHVGRST